MPLQISPQLEEFYRNSPMREGILNWYPFTLGSMALDLSDGILTKLLLDKGVNAVALNDTKVKEGVFDYIICIDPVEISMPLLRQFHSYLNAHGRLLIAYNNPFGLQYFSGRRNPRTNLPYQFWAGESKKEVEARLKLSGFEGQKWYYPFSNHYFTREVYSENYLPNTFLNHRGHVLMEGDYTKSFDERSLWKEIIRGGAFEFMCNAYLVEARVCQSDEACDVDFAAITAYREREKAFITTVHCDGTARKKAVFEDGRKRLAQIAENHENLKRLGVNILPVNQEGDSLIMARVNLPTLWDDWTGKLLSGELNEEVLFSQYDRIRDAIYKSAKEGKCYWELVPANCFFDAEKDEMIFFDQEYYWENTDPDMVLVRAIYALKYSNEFKRYDKTDMWIESLKKRYNLTEKWDVLANLADNKTRAFVFNAEQTSPLERAIVRAQNRTTELIAERAAENSRYMKMCEAVKGLKVIGLKHPAIYGYGIRGKMFRYALEMSDIDAACIVDRQLPNVSGIPLFESVENIAAEVKIDVVVVTPIKGAEDIAATLRKLVGCRVVTVEELINEQN